MGKSKGVYDPAKIQRPLSKKAQRNQNLDTNCLENTPIIMRMEIDRIFKTFVDDPESSEYIFPSDLNNFQRKYIHFKAAQMNFISRSYGREPNRNLHIRKKAFKQKDTKNFNISICPNSTRCLDNFAIMANENINDVVLQKPKFRGQKRMIGKLSSSKPGVPPEAKYNPELKRFRNSLPVYEHRNEIVETIKANKFVILSSETGSGKTTQVPQYILEDAFAKRTPCKIICTQPRRISTVAVAERVAVERRESVGDTIGYHIKLEQKYGAHSNLIYCTTGVFLRNLMGSSDALQNITHIIIDEIHERDKLSDFILICLKQHVHNFPNLRVVLMSATINCQKFVDYFTDVKVLSIPGRVFPIETHFLEEILASTNYMSPKMLEADCNGKSKKKKPVNTAYEKVEKVDEDVDEMNECMDEELDSYLTFSDNYDYTVDHEEATAQIFMYFISEGVSVNYQHSQTGRTALMLAAHLGDKTFISRLCNMGADLNLRCKLGQTAFDYACNEEIIMLLKYVQDEREGEPVADPQTEGLRLLDLYDITTPEDVIDFNLIVTVISSIHNSGIPGSILVFLPGYDDIMMCSDSIERSDALRDNNYKIFYLHGSMNIKEQNDVFKEIGRRKIILSTNIAETSITIVDVVYVIDVGKAKEKAFDAYNKVSSLHTKWISQACANQRKGRAGRTKPGRCFRLYSKQRYENMDVERVPEILRISLEEICLHAKVRAPDDMDIDGFLSLALDAPAANSIRVAVEHLQFLGALDKDEDLTVLGSYLAQLTLEPHLGKILIGGVITKCLDPILTLVATLSHKDPFQLPPQANLKTMAAGKRKELINGVLSDHLLYLELFRKFEEATASGNASRFCQEYFLSQNAMSSIIKTKSQLMAQLKMLNFVTSSSAGSYRNTHSDCWPLVKGLICTGLYPNVAYPHGNKLQTRRATCPSISNFSACSHQEIRAWLVYDEMLKQKGGFSLRGVTAVTPLTVGLFCGMDTIIESPTELEIDDWLNFSFPNANVINLRKALDNIYQKVITEPSYRYSKFDDLTLNTLETVLNEEEKTAELRIPRYFDPLQTLSTYVPPHLRRHAPSNHHRHEQNSRGGAVPRGGLYRNDFRPGGSHSRGHHQQSYSRQNHYRGTNSYRRVKTGNSSRSIEERRDDFYDSYDRWKHY
ncbi:ATP-dependent DNA/RNA helicase DHX36 isoform X2 [Diabrotica virgifera virgifera]|uniref:ATP-dependent DNA/RNA helicase DHX36-like isoform X2 n=1 Tax=Diabrotica virgifera virgifera TaxID=50390 RepID=A0A6P7GEP1_DIAVI|nr:ATP-dependent DNA/RNA helicase DHX36 isoform X2 [Diabrotica virgifera virgifera]